MKMVSKAQEIAGFLLLLLNHFSLFQFSRLGYRPTITYEDTGNYNNNAQQSGYDSNSQGFGGY